MALNEGRYVNPERCSIEFCNDKFFQGMRKHFMKKVVEWHRTKIQKLILDQNCRIPRTIEWVSANRGFDRQGVDWRYGFWKLSRLRLLEPDEWLRTNATLWSAMGSNNDATKRQKTKSGVTWAYNSTIKVSTIAPATTQPRSARRTRCPTWNRQHRTKASFWRGSSTSH